MYFWASADFSPKRFVQQIWRMNFLAALLAMATNTAWIDYYFVALATRPFHREARFSPGDQCYHWNNNCESYWRVGVAMGESMLELTSRRED